MYIHVKKKKKNCVDLRFLTCWKSDPLDSQSTLPRNWKRREQKIVKNSATWTKKDKTHPSFGDNFMLSESALYGVSKFFVQVFI